MKPVYSKCPLCRRVVRPASTCDCGDCPPVRPRRTLPSFVLPFLLLAACNGDPFDPLDPPAPPDHPRELQRPDAGPPDVPDLPGSVDIIVRPDIAPPDAPDLTDPPPDIAPPPPDAPPVTDASSPDASSPDASPQPDLLGDLSDAEVDATPSPDAFADTEPTPTCPAQVTCIDDLPLSVSAGAAKGLVSDRGTGGPLSAGTYDLTGILYEPERSNSTLHLAQPFGSIRLDGVITDPDDPTIAVCGTFTAHLFMQVSGHGWNHRAAGTFDAHRGGAWLQTDLCEDQTFNVTSYTIAIINARPQLWLYGRGYFNGEYARLHMTFVPQETP